MEYYNGGQFDTIENAKMALRENDRKVEADWVAELKRLDNLKKAQKAERKEAKRKFMEGQIIETNKFVERIKRDL